MSCPPMDACIAALDPTPSIQRDDLAGVSAAGELGRLIDAFARVVGL